MTTMFYCAVHCGMVGLSMEPWRSPSIKGKADRFDRGDRLITPAAVDYCAWEKQKREPISVPFKKIGSDLLFHKQVQYHRRCGA